MGETVTLLVRLGIALLLVIRAGQLLHHCG